ncbi:MAG: cell division protein FtsW [Citromicrobium sp.]|nr:cell division protein FtsW [Citromicrobium sp.]MAO95759.1 cell division protein FtsW [Citromicrobium sp.]MAS85637.1 cell division protein FtsW [Erythrobacteraceae bacterium]MBT46260.1 cell division protein FtsW [Citromicrobium sp.]|tara:strand:+ start:2398 stop:3618 length:1221 start_codon:yes stop_codon:yes gene_type:complete
MNIAPATAIASELPGRTNRRETIRARLKIWWRELDHVLLGLIVILIAVGCAAISAASPAGAARLSSDEVTLNPLRFLFLHLRWLAVGVPAMIGLSMLSRDSARRFAILLSAAMVAAMLLVPFIGSEVNGARRWLNLGFSFQPSEFLKPGFAITLAWIMSWRLKDPEIPSFALVTGALGVVVVLLMAQPNLGDAILFSGVWFVLVLLGGVSFRHIAGLFAGGLIGLTLAYAFYDNARHRIDSWLFGGTDFDQVDLAQRTLLAGGWDGVGFWVGVKKFRLPEAQTDYIFSVVGEEFGLLACGAIVLLFFAIVLRVLVRLASEENYFALLAAAGLTAQLGAQAFINILVNLSLFPSKGMTLPLVSYGGSSTIAVCMSLGLLLALTRRNPFLTRETAGLRNMLFDKERDK